jgi:hypothetical protein
MKRLLFLFLVFSITANSQITQDTADARLLRYDTTVTIPLSDKYGLQRIAKFRGFSYNLESQQLHIIWHIMYKQGNQTVSLFGKDYELKYQIADAETFVNMAGEIIDTTGHAGPFIREIDFYKLIANRGTGAQNATINQLILQAGLRPGKWKE